MFSIGVGVGVDDHVVDHLEGGQLAARSSWGTYGR